MANARTPDESFDGLEPHVPQAMDRRTARRRLRAWEELGVWDRLHAHVLKLFRKEGEPEHDTAAVVSLTVRALVGRTRFLARRL